MSHTRYSVGWGTAFRDALADLFHRAYEQRRAMRRVRYRAKKIRAGRSQ